MFHNSEATESSRKRASVQSTLGSTESHLDSSSYPYIDKADTKLSGNKAQSAYPPPDASGLPPLVPVRRPPTQSQSQPNIQDQSTTIYPPVSQKGSTPVSRTNSANWVVPQGSQQPPLRSSPESYRVPITQTPQMYSSRTYGDIPVSPYDAPQMPYQSSDPKPPQTLPSLRPQQYVTPFQQNSTYPGTPSRPYKPQSVIGPQTYSSGPTRPFAQSAPPQSFGPTRPPTLIKGGTFTSTSHAPDFGQVPSPLPSSGSHVPPRPNAHSAQIQARHEGTPQQFVPQSAPPQGRTFNPSTSGFGRVPRRPSSLIPIARAVQPQTSRRKVDAFVASDPFRMLQGDEVDEPSDGLTFDDILTPPSDPGSKFSRGMASGPYENLSSKPTLGGDIPPSEEYKPSHNFIGPPPSKVPTLQMPLRRPSWSPEARIQPQVRPGRPEPDDASEQADGSAKPYLPSMQSKPPTPMSWPPMQSQAPVDSPVPSAQQSGLTSDDTQDLLDYIPSELHEPQAATDETSLTPPTPALHYLGHPGHPFYLQHHSQCPELSKDSFFSRFARFFRWSHHTHSPPIFPDTNRHEREFTKVALKFVLVTIPVQMYLHFFLLRLPSLYFSRVARIFEEADMTLLEIKKMALETASPGFKHEFEIQSTFESSSVPPAYQRLKSTWEFFIDSVMREWKTFNIISVLLLTYVRSSLHTMLVPNLISCRFI